LDSFEHDFCRHFDLATASIINSIIFGQQFTVDNRESEFDELKTLSSNLMKIVLDPIKIGLINCEFIRRLPFFCNLSSELIEVFGKINRVVDRKIQECSKKLDFLSRTPSYYVEAFMQEKVELDQQKLEHTFSHFQLRASCLDMWIAGTETTSATLSWIIAYMVLNRDVQGKVHEELDRVIGRGEKVLIRDRAQLPYLSAVIVEGQRCSNIFIQNLIRRTTRDTIIDGFFLKKGQAVIPQISVILADPNVFPEPEKFNPNRFLDENGCLIGTEKVFAFSLGKRSCLGEGLARSELHLFLGNIMSKFRLLPANELPRLERQNNSTASAIVPYKVRIESRI